MKWLKLKGQVQPMAICEFAKPKSASKSITRLPDICSAMAKFTATVVLPTPPLPLATPMTSVRVVFFILFLQMLN